MHSRSIQNYISGQKQRTEYHSSWQRFWTLFVVSYYFKEDWLVHRKEEERNCSIRRLRFAGIILYYLRNDHAKIFSDPSEETWMPPENWVESENSCWHCPHSDSLSVAALFSANTKPLKGLFLWDIDSTLEAEPKF